MKCKSCNKDFDAQRRNQRFCSRKCRRRVWIPVQKLCRFCSQAFTEVRANQVYCSTDCRHSDVVKSSKVLRLPSFLFVGTRAQIAEKLLDHLEKLNHLTIAD